MNTTPHELVGQLHCIDGGADPHEVALHLAWTGERWFEGLSPALTWAMTWIESAGQPQGVRHGLHRAIRVGYRHGRELLGTVDGPHPDAGHEELTDVVAELLCTLAVEATTPELFDALPPVVARAHDHLALLVATGFPGGGELSIDQRRELCRLGADLGLVLAAVEHQLDRAA